MSLPCKFHEVHYCNLQSQSNIYGLAKLSLPGGMYKILIASLRGKVLSMEFQQTRPSSREVHFTYIPGDAEIVSIDAFTKLHGSGVVVGIAFIKPTEGGLRRPCQVLNVYSEWEQGSEYHLDSIAQGCQNIELSFIPYQLYHVELVQSGNTETVFLLSGSDHKVHMFREDRSKHTFSEEPAEAYFPEFADLPSSVTWMQCKPCHDLKRRVTAMGCQNGYVRCSVVNTESSASIMQSWEIQHDSPIVSVELFTLQTEVECPSSLSQVLEPLEDTSEAEELPEYHLLVVSAIEPTVVYRNLLEGFSDPLLLAESDRFDCAMCSLVADIDMDGQNEILLGTYGQQLLIYKFQTRKSAGLLRQLSTAVEDHFGSDNASVSEDSPVSDDPSTVSDISMTKVQTDMASSQSCPVSPLKQRDMDGVTHEKSMAPKELPSPSRQHPSLSDGTYQLLLQRSFSAPLLAMREVDITGDGVQEIVVLSLRGLHILQHDVEAVSELCLQRLKEAAKLMQGRDEEDVFTQLLSENLS